MSASAPLPTIDVAEADRRLREDPAHPILLDVREPNEFVAVRAPGAVLLPTSTFAARVGELPLDRPILVICHSGNRSAAVTGFLTRSGRSDVVNVAGGMEDWERAGLPIRRGSVAPGEGELSPASGGAAPGG
jgi:rhodanese-related sulfurtransferase